VQSTQNIEKVNKIVAKLKSYVKELLFFNTICRPTRVRQREIKRMPLENEVMIIIGSKNSANTKRLYEIAKSLNKKTYWVGTKDDIRKVWFKNVKSTGVTAGASTPGRTTQEVITHIKKISS
jgi:4-hydroxy-3-methylbut-2-enyl diphosphate reductase